VRETAALRDFDPLYVRFGSIATEEAEAARQRMSALRPKANMDRSARCGA
jgi:hypothetical protein